MTKELQKLRNKITKIDNKIKSQLSKREDLVKKVGKMKKKLGINIEDLEREADVLTGLGEEYIGKIYKKIIEESKNIQKRL
jgi:chorismate mutase